MKLEKLRLKNRERLNLISNLCTMITAGIPVHSAIHAMTEEAKGNVKIVLDTMSQDLLTGKHLYESLAQFPRIFDSVTVNMVKAAEDSGTLDVTLKDVKEQIKKDIELQRKVKSAMTYPVLVMVVFTLILTMILVVVIPKIAVVFTQLKVHIPLPTRIMMGMSDILLHYPLVVLAVVIALTAGSIALYRVKRQKIIQLFGSLPVIRNVVRTIDLWRFTRSLYLLINAGTTIPAALELTEKVVVKPEVARAINFTYQSVLTGSPLSASFKQHKKVFPTSMIELVQAGEKTGTIDDSFHNVSEYLDEEISDSIDLLTTLLEPILLVMVAIMVGALMVAIIGPIYGMIGSIGPSAAPHI